MRLLNLGIAAVLLGGMVMAKDPAGAPAAVEKKAEAKAAAEDAQNKLLPLISMEQAFVKALQKRNALVVLISRQQEALKSLKGDELKKASENLLQLRKVLAQRISYMDAIYRLDGTRNYEYNPVTSTIYLRVGTVSEVFSRAVKTRNFYAARAVALKTDMDKEKDTAKKAELKKQYEAAAANWALMVNALYDVFQVHPKRQYQFDPANSVLFLKTSDAEIKKLQAELAKAQKVAAPKKTEKKSK